MSRVFYLNPFKMDHINSFKQSYFMTSVTFNHIFQHPGPEPDRGEDELHQGLAESPGIRDQSVCRQVPR